MAYNTNKTTAPIRSLVNAGADLMNNMYDVRIFFPSTNGGPEAESFHSYPITVRAEGFDIPDFEIPAYQIKYHGVEIDRPKPEQNFKRQFTINFREDAAFDLRRRFSAWLMAIGDPVTGGVSNATQFFGRVEVGTIAGAYFATTINSPNGSGKGINAGSADIEDDYGHITTRNDINPLALWKFYNVWVRKITSPKFKTENSDAGKFTVDFSFMDCDYPQFGGNVLSLGTSDKDKWKTPSNSEWTSKLEPAG